MSHWTPHDWAVALIALAALGFSLAALGCAAVAVSRLADLAGACSG